MPKQSDAFRFFYDRYSPAYRVASWWMNIKTICFVLAGCVAILGMFAAAKVGAGAFFAGACVAAGLVVVGLVFEVFAALLRVLIDAAAASAPTLSEDERYALISSSATADSRVSGGGISSSARSAVSAIDRRVQLKENETMRYTQDRGLKMSLDKDQIVARVQAAPDAEHLVWIAGMSGWAAPHELEIFDGCLEDEEVEKTDELGE